MKHLADHFFNCKQYDIADQLVFRALKYSEKYHSSLLKSDLFFIQGKIHHIRENYTESLDCYFKVTKLNPSNFAAHFNKAKIHFLNNQFPAAEESLGKVLSNPKFKECTDRKSVV